MTKVYILKKEQTTKAIRSDIEVDISEEVSTTNTDTTCLRKMDATIEGIDNQIVQLQEDKVKLETEKAKIEIEVDKYSL